MIRPVRPPPAWVAREWAVHGGMLGGALALTLIVWWPAAHGWFLLDDYRWLLPSDRRFDVLRSFISTWGHGYAYRPLMRLSFLADLQIFGWDARGWHLHNLVLHAVNATLLFSLIRAATGVWLPAIAIAALFIVSPVGHENVAWISGRTFLLGACFFLASANLLLQSVLMPDTRRGEQLFWWGVAAFVAAMATYEATIALPLLAWATMRCFPSLAAAPPAIVSRRVRDLFLILLVFFVCRVVLLRGHIGNVGGWSYWWFYEPLHFYVTIYVMNGHTARIVVPIVVMAAWVACALLMRVAPAAARRVPQFLAIAALILFLPFINSGGTQDRFFYLIQVSAIATVVLLLWLIARLSRAGAVVATAAMLVLIGAGAADSHQAAREWAAAGTIARSVADELKRLHPHPTWPDGTDIVVDTLPRMIGRAPVYVLYTKESMLQRFPNPVMIDARVYFGEILAANPALRAERGDRPAKYFQFDDRTYRLTELSAMEWEQVHATAAR